MLTTYNSISKSPLLLLFVAISLFFILIIAFGIGVIGVFVNYFAVYYVFLRYGEEKINSLNLYLKKQLL